MDKTTTTNFKSNTTAAIAASSDKDSMMGIQSQAQKKATTKTKHRPNQILAITIKQKKENRRFFSVLSQWSLRLSLRNTVISAKPSIMAFKYHTDSIISVAQISTATTEELLLRARESKLKKTTCAK
jgi:predicted protein tyrosine phosphatase